MNPWGQEGHTTSTEDMRAQEPVKFADPPKAKWSFSLNGTSEILFCVPTAPNWFHRFMQKLVLGVVWRRL